MTDENARPWADGRRLACDLRAEVLLALLAGAQAAPPPTAPMPSNGYSGIPERPLVSFRRPGHGPGGQEDRRTGGQEDRRTGGQEDRRTGGIEDRTRMSVKR